jgi:hypothetical protein
MRKTSDAALAAAALAITGAVVVATTGSGIAAPAKPGPTAEKTTAPAPQNNAAIEWNQALLDITAAPPAKGAPASTIQPTRNFAILALAIDGAVNSIDHTHRPTTGEPTADPGASAPAAAASAGHDALVALYPDHLGDLDTRLANDLATMPNDNATQQGLLVGQAAARLILDSRAHDGPDTPAPPYSADPAPGRYQPTPPASAPPVFTGWAAVMLFVLHSGDQFRPAAPPALDSQVYAAALTETQQPDDDQNDGTTADVNWEPLANTPADPSYPGAHSDLGFAAATVLAHQYGDSNRFTVTSSTLPGVNRTFSQFSDAATRPA